MTDTFNLRSFAAGCIICGVALAAFGYGTGIRIDGYAAGAGTFVGALFFSRRVSF